MRTNSRISFFGLCFLLVIMAGTVLLYLVPEANAVYGTRRRTARRTAVIVSSADEAETQQAEQEAAEADARADAAEAENDSLKQASAAQAAPATTAAAAPAGALPLGSVVSTLPEGCTKKVVNNIEYYFDGLNYYRAAFQGSTLVYVTAQP